ncbi:hypothetical protein BIFDEN_02267 [Bifidobacterium dentium ATCC 27678]|nr:hypothetical protein BIFDEN_02267 [Bifidobacterium dentium ATCC 27678]ETO96547.1 hypothetical protein HMPREF1494_1955 [Bifidobacterium sp. MSTE12]
MCLKGTQRRFADPPLSDAAADAQSGTSAPLYLVKSAFRD